MMEVTMRQESGQGNSLLNHRNRVKMVRAKLFYVLL
jgi:hypothetical protein